MYSVQKGWLAAHWGPSLNTNGYVVYTKCSIYAALGNRRSPWDWVHEVGLGLSLAMWDSWRNLRAIIILHDHVNDISI